MEVVFLLQKGRSMKQLPWKRRQHLYSGCEQGPHIEYGCSTGICTDKRERDGSKFNELELFSLKHKHSTTSGAAINIYPKLSKRLILFRREVDLWIMQNWQPKGEALSVHSSMSGTSMWASENSQTSREKALQKRQIWCWDNKSKQEFTR